MKKYIYYLWIIATAWMFVSCDDEEESVNPENILPEIKEDRGVEPGTEYEVEDGVKYLNVVYLVPQGMEPVNDWHWRLSGIMNHVQNFYKDRLSRHYGVEENFRMIRNKANPSYVNIILIRGEQPVNAYTSLYRIQSEVEKYFRSHADEKKSHHTVVLMPQGLPSGVIYGYDAMNIPNETIGIAACDADEFNIKYFRYTHLRGAYLQQLGEVIRATGLAMNMAYNTPEKDDVYSSITTSPSRTYVANPDKWRLTPADKKMLVSTELFQDQLDYFDMATVTINSVNLSVVNSNLNVVCSFSSSIKPTTFFVYNDFFRATDEEGLYSEEAELLNENMSTVKDAMVYSTDQITVMPSLMGGYMCNVTISVPLTGIPDEYLEAFPSQDYAKAELRFRILHENGTYSPSLNYAKCGAFYRDADIHPDRFRYFYFLNSLGNVVQPMPYESHPEAHDKSTWEIEVSGYLGSILRATLLDNKTDVSWQFRDWSIGNKTQIKILPKGKYMHGIKIHPGKENDRVNKVSIDVHYYDFDEATYLTKRLVDNYKFVDNGEYYYYIGLTPDTKKDLYVYDFTITIEGTVAGTSSASLAEIGTYGKY